MKNENTMIKTNINMQQICPTDFPIRRTYQTNYGIFPFQTLNLQNKVHFTQNDFPFGP